jgi:hypothetical protein
MDLDDGIAVERREERQRRPMELEERRNEAVAIIGEMCSKTY